MSRLQKKCFVGATSLHFLLLLALVVGPGFFNRTKPAEDVPLLEIIPMMATDENFSGGGVRPPAERLPTPQPIVAQPTPPPPARDPEPPPQQQEERVERAEPDKIEPERNPRPDRDAPVTPKDKPKFHQVNVSTTRVRINRPSTATTRNSSSPGRAEANANSEIASAIARVGTRVRSGLSTTTQVDMPEGPGGGGVSYANYGQIVRKIYTDAWRVPDDMSDDEASIKVSVTIARDGTVLSARIVQSSGSAAADRSIQNALDRIRTIGLAFPAGAKESQRTFNLTFNLKAKKAFG